MIRRCGLFHFFFGFYICAINFICQQPIVCILFANNKFYGSVAKKIDVNRDFNVSNRPILVLCENCFLCLSLTLARASFVKSRGKQTMRDESFLPARRSMALQHWEFESIPTMNNSESAHVCVCVCALCMKDIISFKLIALIMILRPTLRCFEMNEGAHNALIMSMYTAQRKKERLLRDFFVCLGFWPLLVLCWCVCHNNVWATTCHIYMTARGSPAQHNLLNLMNGMEIVLLGVNRILLGLPFRGLLSGRAGL